MKRVFIVVILAWETTSYLVVLSCTTTCLMRRFYVDDNYAFKKERKIRDYRFFLVVENCARRELNSGMKLQKVSRIPR